MSEFDAKATDWDQNNIHHERSLAIAAALKELIPFSREMKVMEFGAGTGLLSFILHDLFASITLIDSSPQMIRVCNEKIALSNSSNIKAIKIDLETDNIDDKFDFIYTQMAFHHITDVNIMIRKFYHLLKEKGLLAVADLFPEDGSFHGEGFTGHKGFDPEWLSNLMLNSGFKNVTYKTSFIQKKIDADGTLKDYPVFLIIAKKFSS